MAASSPTKAAIFTGARAGQTHRIAKPAAIPASAQPKLRPASSANGRRRARTAKATRWSDTKRTSGTARRCGTATSSMPARLRGRAISPARR
jgi:hypothetical protein